MVDDIKKLIEQYTVQNYQSGYNCSECVFDALLSAGVINAPDRVLSMCVGFGGGLGLSGYTCGALAGATMALGWVNGRHDIKNLTKEERAAQLQQKYYRRYNRLLHDFKDAHGKVLCRDLVGDKEWLSVERRGMCQDIITKTALLTYDYILMPQEEAFALPYRDNVRNLK